MADFHVALDDYLHQIVRTRPWIKKREEELLTAFGEWLVEQPNVRSELAAITIALVQRYATAEELAAPVYGELERALRNFLVWADYAGLLHPAQLPIATPDDSQLSHLGDIADQGS